MAQHDMAEGSLRQQRGRQRDRMSAHGEISDVTRGSACYGGSSADDAEPKTGSLSHGFHPDRFEVNAVESGVLE